MDAATSSPVVMLLVALGSAVGLVSASSGLSRHPIAPNAALLSNGNAVGAKNRSSPQWPIDVRHAAFPIPGLPSGAPLQLAPNRGNGGLATATPSQRSSS